jgi:hypothetical protein
VSVAPVATVVARTRAAVVVAAAVTTVAVVVVAAPTRPEPVLGAVVAAGRRMPTGE